LMLLMPSSWRLQQGDLPQAQSLYEGNRIAEFTASNLLMDGYFPVLVHIVYLSRICSYTNWSKMDHDAVWLTCSNHPALKLFLLALEQAKNIPHKAKRWHFTTESQSRKSMESRNSMKSVRNGAWHTLATKCREYFNLLWNSNWWAPLPTSKKMLTERGSECSRTCAVATSLPWFRSIRAELFRMILLRNCGPFCRHLNYQRVL
jgi:hypothetical protein